MEDSLDINGKNYDSDLSDLFILSQDPRKDSFVPIKYQFTFEQSREAYCARRERNKHFPGIWETRTSFSLPFYPSKINNRKNFTFRSNQLGDVTPTAEDIGRFYLFHQNTTLSTEFRALVDRHLLKTSYG